MEILRPGALLAATLVMGLMAGVFGLYSHTIMPGLEKTDDRTFVGAFQEIDRAIMNPWFMASFMGALILTAVAAVLYVVVFVVTIAVNVPLNDELKAAGDPDRIADLAAVREQFDETKWVRWNLARTLATTAAFGCLAWALVLHGRAGD